MRTGHPADKRVKSECAVSVRRLTGSWVAVIAVLTVSPALQTTAHAAAPVPRGDPLAQPAIDWERQVFVSRGLGAPDFAALNPSQARLGAEKAAVELARKEMLKILRTAPMRQGALQFGPWLQKRGDKNAEVTLSQTAKVTAKRFFSDRGVEVEVEIPFHLLNPHLRGEAQTAAAAAVVSADAGVAPSQHSGLVVVLSAPAFPSLNPLVADDAGNVLYSVDSLSLASAKTTAVAVFVPGLGAAQKRGEVGAVPLVCRASLGREGAFTLSKEDATKVRLLDRRILLEGRVVFALETLKK
jgi:hypothetical protein